MFVDDDAEDELTPRTFTNEYAVAYAERLENITKAFPSTDAHPAMQTFGHGDAKPELKLVDKDAIQNASPLNHSNIAPASVIFRRRIGRRSSSDNFLRFRHTQLLLIVRLLNGH
jgi:hypothetical protein